MEVHVIKDLPTSPTKPIVSTGGDMIAVVYSGKAEIWSVELK